MWGVNVTEGDVGGLHFFDVTEHQTGKTVENKGETVLTFGYIRGWL